MLSSTRKCWPSDFFGATLTAGRPKAAVGVQVDPALQLRGLDAADVREHGERVEDVRRLVAPAAHGLGGEVRAVRLGEDPVGGHDRSRLAKVGRLRIGDVAGEGNVVPALEGGLEQRGAEKQWRTTVPEKAGSAAAVSASASRVCTTTGSLEDAASSSWLSKSTRCSRRCGRVAEVVEAGLTTATTFGRAIRSPSSPTRAASPVPAWCGSMPRAAKTPSSSVGDRERGPAGRDPRADRDHP